MRTILGELLLCTQDPTSTKQLTKSLQIINFSISGSFLAEYKHVFCSPMLTKQSPLDPHPFPDMAHFSSSLEYFSDELSQCIVSDSSPPMLSETGVCKVPGDLHTAKSSASQCPAYSYRERLVAPSYLKNFLLGLQDTYSTGFPPHLILNLLCCFLLFFPVDECRPAQGLSLDPLSYLYFVPSSVPPWKRMPQAPSSSRLQPHETH